MVDALALKQIFSLESAAWIAVALLFLFVVRMWNGAPAMFEQWIAYRRAKAEEKAADWTRLRDHCNFLIEAEERCRSELRDVQTRLATLEGYMAGQGAARQEAAGVVALERLEKENEREK
jgi:hypothetical protein